VRERRAPLVGVVSMDATTIDVSSIPGVQMGDVVTLIGDDGDEKHHRRAGRGMVGHHLVGRAHLPRPARGEALLGINGALARIPDEARQVYVNWHF